MCPVSSRNGTPSSPRGARRPVRVPAAGRLLAVAALLAGASGCGVLGADAQQNNDEPSNLFPVSSSAFRDGAPIPARFGCKVLGGMGKTPPLRWSFADAKAFAIVVDDPDAPHGDYVQWVIANIDKNTTELVEPAQLTANGAVEGRNGAGTVGYTPPCPPKGDKPHRYRFTVYALSGKVQMKSGAQLKDSLPPLVVVWPWFSLVLLCLD